MDIKKLNQSMYIFTRQLMIEDLPRLKELGIKTIISNRPDNEVASQPSFKMIQTEAKKLGIESVHIPIYRSGMTDGDINHFKNALDLAKENNQLPVIAYCRTATRSTRLWSVSQIGALKREKIKKIASDAGYDVSDLVS